MNSETEVFVPFTKIKDNSDIIYKVVVFPMLKEIAKFIMKNYDEIDIDDSKSIDRKELTTLLEGLVRHFNLKRKITETDVENLFIFLDMNEDEKLGLAEFKESECLPWIHSIIFMFNDTNNKCPNFMDTIDEDKKFISKI